MTRAEPGVSTARQKQQSQLYADRPTRGLPAYGFVHPTHGVYADHLARGLQGPWIPRPAVRRAATDPALQGTLTEELHRLAFAGPFIADLATRVGDTLDLAWIVTTAGAATVWPPYDVPRVIESNPDVVDLDESTMEYVTLGAPDQNPDRGPRWTQLYLDRFKGVWLTSVIHPLYVDGRFRGTAGADLRLASIAERVTGIDLGLPGYTVLVGPNGAIVATTPALLEDLGDDAPWRDALTESLKPAALQRWTSEGEAALASGSLTTAATPGLRQLGALSDGRDAGRQRVVLAGIPRMVVHAPLRSPNWTLLLVVPEAAIAARSQAVRTTIASGADEVGRQFTLFAGAVLLLVVASSRLMQRYAVEPLQSLARRVGALSVDKLQLETDGPERLDEFGELEGKVRELLQLVDTARDGERTERALVNASLAAIRDPVVGTDGDGVIRLLNVAAEYLLGPRDRVLGTTLSEVLRLRRRDGTEVDDPSALLAEADASFVVPERFTVRSGEQERVIEVCCAPLPLPGGDGGALFVLRDVTERERLDDELVRIQKLEGVQALAAGVAHDFNNVLAGVLGYIALARAASPAGSATNDHLERAENAVDRARAVTTRLSTFSASGDPVLGRTALPPVFEEARNQPTGPTPLPNGRYVCVSIVDTGPGIPAAVRPRVGDAFFSTRPGAAGLGVAVSESILRKHGGMLQIESVEGTGTTVRIWLPVDESAAEAKPRPQPRAERPRVLFLDDDDDLREVTEAMLRGCGLAPTGVAEGSAALSLWLAAREAGTPFDLVLLDLTVPNGMGGAETLAEMRQHDPEVLAVVCSGYGKEGVLGDPARYGFKGRLRKPFDLATMKTELWRVLNSRGGSA
jgi:nitrogen-specific signal transduction histidine kinase/HAMP domain-containing protein/ActR/RegA family two-component response regulator